MQADLFKMTPHSAAVNLQYLAENHHSCNSWKDLTGMNIMWKKSKCKYHGPNREKGVCLFPALRLVNMESYTRTAKIWHWNKDSGHLPKARESFHNPAPRKWRIHLQLALPAAQLASPSWAWIIPLQGAFSLPFSRCDLFPFILSLTHSQVHAVFFPPPNFVLSCSSLTALLIWPLFRSIFLNQYLISERSAGLLQYVPWRIFKTHGPRSPFNLFTQKVMRYWIGLRHTDVEPMPSNGAALPQNSCPAIKLLIASDAGASFFFICFSFSG